MKKVIVTILAVIMSAVVLFYVGIATEIIPTDQVVHVTGHSTLIDDQTGEIIYDEDYSYTYINGVRVED